MNAPAPVRSVSKTTLLFGPYEIPIKLYKGTDRIGLSGQLFHDGCNGKIRQWKTCELHPNTTDPATFSGVLIADTIVPLDSGIKTGLLGGDTKMHPICTHPMKNLTPLITEGVVVPSRTYQIAPEEHWEDYLATLLDRLRVSKTFLLVQFAEGSMKRFGILFSTGTFMSIYYDEEVRERKFVPGKPRAEFKGYMDDAIAHYKTDSLPRLTAIEILSRIEDWYSQIVVKINKSRGARAKRTKVRT